MNNAMIWYLGVDLKMNLKFKVITRGYNIPNYDCYGQSTIILMAMVYTLLLNLKGTAYQK